MKFKDVIQALDVFNISTEEFYKLIDLKKHLISMDKDNIEVQECILTPYYIHGNKRLELYEYELNIRKVEKLNFEKFLLNLTGQKDIKNIPENIIELQKNCYIKLENDNTFLSINILHQYVDYIINSIELQNQIKDCFGLYNVEEFYFAFY